MKVHIHKDTVKSCTIGTSLVYVYANSGSYGFSVHNVYKHIARSVYMHYKCFGKIRNIVLPNLSQSSSNQVLQQALFMKQILRFVLV